MLSAILLSVALFQAQGKITVSTKVLGVAAEAGVVTLSIAPSAAPEGSVDLTCSASGAVAIPVTRFTPPVGATSGLVTTCSHQNDSITVTLRRAATSDPVSWSIAANDVKQEGTF